MFTVICGHFVTKGSKNMKVNKPGACSAMLRCHITFIKQLTYTHRESISPLLKETQRACRTQTVLPFISVSLPEEADLSPAGWYTETKRVTSVPFFLQGNMDKNKRLPGPPSICIHMKCMTSRIIQILSWPSLYKLTIYKLQF